MYCFIKIYLTFFIISNKEKKKIIYGILLTPCIEKGEKKFF